MTAPTLHTATAHTVTTSGGHSAAIMSLVLLAALVYGIAHRISVHRYPYKNCTGCGGTGRRGAPFLRAHRTCAACGGSGEQLRRYAKKPD